MQYGRTDNGISSLVRPDNGISSFVRPDNGISSLVRPDNGMFSLVRPHNGISSLVWTDGQRVFRCPIVRPSFWDDCFLKTHVTIVSVKFAERSIRLDRRP